MIFTGYFAGISKLPKNVEPVSIARWSPKAYSGLEYRKLAPTNEILAMHRVDEGYAAHGFYSMDFRRRVLDWLNPDEVVRELHKLTDKPDIALVCYERPERFCHRHLVADWLNEHGIECYEWGGETQ